MLYHTGPAQVFLSKAPGALEDYEGDGEWFKIALMGSSDGRNWDTYNTNEVGECFFRRSSVPQEVTC